MSVLASLVEAYDRLPDAPPFGYSMEKIGMLISLNADGTVASVTDWRVGDKKKQPRMVLVPQAVKRASGIICNFLWDKTAYALGVTVEEGKRTADEHRCFIERHLRDIGESDDEGLRAFLLFLQSWTPEQYRAPQWPDDLKDQNVIFTLESDRLQSCFLHDRPAAKKLWNRIRGGDDSNKQICLVTGENAPIARLHPAIKGVWGAQSSGASLVSFNLDAFTSYGHEQGDNAPVSDSATFAYGTALNRFLEPDSGHRLQIGDAATIFWAEAQSLEAALLAEMQFLTAFEAKAEAQTEESTATQKVKAQLEQLRAGKPLSVVAPELVDGVRFYVLGLAPNAARLSVRFFIADSFAHLTENYQHFVDDMRIEPPPRGDYPPLWRYLVETAVLGKRENVPPNLAGEWMRSILSNTRYPLTLMSLVLTRIRADGRVNAERASILKAVLKRNFKKEVPVALDTDCCEKGYVLGRLFAVLDQVQSAALGPKVNATIKDKYYGSASSQPRKVFPVLINGSVHHLSKIGKQKPGRKVNLEKLIGELMDMMSPSGDPFPIFLSSEQQSLFSLGYYHQHNEFFKKAAEPAATEEMDA